MNDNEEDIRHAFENAEEEPQQPRSHAYRRKTNSNSRNGQGAHDDSEIVYRAKIIRMNEVEAEKIQWLWKGNIALGKIALMAGDPGLGKSVAALDLAACTSAGYPWPDGTDGCDPGKVLILSAEDGIEDTIKPRLDRAGATMEKVMCLESIEGHKGEEVVNEKGFSLTNDIAQLREVLAEEGDIRLVIIDPLSAYLGGTDTHKDADVREALTPLKALAEEFNVAVLVILHLNKAAVQAIYRVSGSVAFTAVARVVFAIAAHPTDNDARLFVQIKNNLASPAPARVFHIDPPDTEDNDQRIKVVWRGISELTKEQIFDPAPVGRKSQGDGGKARLNDAKEFLREFLAEGPRLTKDVEEAAQVDHIALATLTRARTELGIRSQKEPKRFKGKWFCQLPAANKTKTEGEEN